MLQSLTIDNFAIIEHVAIDFAAGMTVLSGETGAGKSIIIDALGLLCGGRGSSEWIRHGSDKLTIEGLFSFESPHPRLQAILQEQGMEIDLQAEDLILRREINAQGKNIIRMNGQLANVSLLKKIGTYLVDIHGQQEHQALLDSTQHLGLLDEFAYEALQDSLTSYHQCYETYTSLRKEWLSASQNEQDQLQRLQFLEFQLQEIEDAELEEGEEEELEELSKRLQNTQTIQQNMEGIEYLLSESDENILRQLDEISSLLSELAEYDDEFEELNERLENLQIELKELAHDILLVDTDVDDEYDIDDIEERLSLLGRLKRKYGMDIDDLIAHYHTISEEVYRIKHREKYLAKLEGQLKEAYEQTLAEATKLSQHRQQQALDLMTAIEMELADLYMANSKFETRFSTNGKDTKLQDLIPEAIQFNESGMEQVEFYVATNVGEVLKPLVKVASGGELSRFMLALKKVFSSTSSPKVMVFDEIDTGVSGRVAQAIAEKMKQIARQHQVLSITHLAQVAAIAHDQLFIHKDVVNERTQTTVDTLNSQERANMIAQMMSGKTISDTSLQLATEMLQELQRVE